MLYFRKLEVFVLILLAGIWGMSLCAQTSVLLNINSSTYPTAVSVANYQAVGVAGLTGGESISQFSPAFNVAFTSPITFSGGQVIYLSDTSNGGTYVKPTGAGATNGLMDCYFYSAAATRTMTVSNLNLIPGTSYTLYLIGTIPVSDAAEDGLFQPINTPNITFSSTISAHGVVAYPFTTSASLSSADTLQFTWARYSSGNGCFQGLAIVPGVPSPTQSLVITNGVRKYAALANTTVTMSGKCELWATSAAAPISGDIINLTSIDSWLFLPNVPPAIAVQPTYLGQIQINGAAAVADSNCRVVQYGQNGTVVIPEPPSFQPLTVYTGAQFTGTATSYGQWTYYTGAAYSNIGSFKLKRGYMAVLAQSANGANYSQSYVAQDGDLEVGVLPSTLSGQVQFIYVTLWRWAPKKGISGDPGRNLLNLGWWYDWGTGGSSSGDLQYVACDWPAGLSQNWQAHQVNALLGFNEPDHSDQANMTVGQAITTWPSLLGTGLRVGSPACSDGGVYSWLFPFMSQTDAAGLRVDFVAQHYYQAQDPSNPSACASHMYNFLLNIWNQTHKPIWVTEWNNGANWTDGNDPANGLYPAPTYAQQQTDIQAMVNMLESTPFVERYALYNWVEDTRAVTTNGVLTGAGVVYRDKVSSLSYSQAMPDNGTRGMAQFLFQTNLWDSSGYYNNGMAVGAPAYATGHNSQSSAIVLDGTNSYVQLPANIAKGNAFTFAAWVYWNGGGNWQRLFDFGAVSTLQGGTPNQYMYFTPSSGGGKLRFAITTSSTAGEQYVEASPLSAGSWQHVAVTLNGSTAILYVNGVQVAATNNISIAPSSFNPTRNFLGKSQWPDPLFNGKLDDVEIADYALSPAQISALYNAFPGPASASGVWGNPSGGHWDTNSDWLNGIIANGVSRVADFSTLDAAGIPTVTLDSDRTVGELRFGDISGSQNWTLGGTNTLTLDAGGGIPATIDVKQNNANITNTLKATSGFDKTGNGTLTLGGAYTGAGNVSVDAGTLTLKGDGSLATARLLIGNTGTGTVTINTSGTVTNNYNGGGSWWNYGALQLGLNGGTGTLNLQSGILNVTGDVEIGQWGGTGTWNQSGGTANVSGTWAVGNFQDVQATFSYGTATVANGTVNAGSVYVGRGHANNNSVVGLLTVASGGVVNSEGDLNVGFAGTANTTGTLNINSGGTVNVGSTHQRWFVIAHYDFEKGVVNVNSGGTLNLNGGTDIQVGYASTNTATLNVNGGSIIGSGPADYDSSHISLNTALSTVNVMNNGLLQVAMINGGGSGATLNIGNGTLRAIEANAGFINLTAGSVNITSGGTTVDTAGFNDTVVNALLDGGGAGGLTKVGNGTLTLAGVNTYSGPTIIKGGTLALSGSASIAGSSSIVISNGATLNVAGLSSTFSLGANQTLKGNGTVTGAATILGTIAPGASIGTLTFVTAPVLNGTTLMEINRTNAQTADEVDLSGGTLNFGGTLTVTNLGPALQAGDNFQLFSAPGYGGTFAVTNLPPLSGGLAWSNSLAVNGTIAVVSTVSLVPTNIVLSVTGTSLNLSWPLDHTGWRLQVQTNDLATGLGTNWFDVANSTNVNQMIIPMNFTSSSVFYRLVYP